MKPKIVFLVGPTAVGKTAVGACLAKKLNAEIVCCDSMQVYKGMEPKAIPEDVEARLWKAIERKLAERPKS